MIHVYQLRLESRHRAVRCVGRVRYLLTIHVYQLRLESLAQSHEACEAHEVPSDDTCCPLKRDAKTREVG